jgi:uncharacterized protein DUF3618
MGEDQGAVRAREVDTAPTDTAPAAQPSPEQLRAEIEDTRQDLGDTVAALAHKTDVKARARDKVAGVKQTVADKKAQIASSGPGSGSGESGGSGGASAAVAQVRTKAEENPVGAAALAAFVGGVVFGRLSKRG